MANMPSFAKNQEALGVCTRLLPSFKVFGATFRVAMASYGLRAAQYKMLTLPPDQQNTPQARKNYIEELEKALLDAKKWDLFFDTAFLHAALASVYEDQRKKETHYEEACKLFQSLNTMFYYVGLKSSGGTFTKGIAFPMDPY
eukprot:Phypoly_transcript_25415.p1 GENE.Phypoly_transcript_25415~~Phypoly_transcript_25415.p1  ORF type:complete len:153 (+),score=29.01 Phypoly_transcript_25415:32-460(+)